MFLCDVLGYLYWYRRMDMDMHLHLHWVTERLGVQMLILNIAVLHTVEDRRAAHRIGVIQRMKTPR